jgi:chemotaxis protein CheD
MRNIVDPTIPNIYLQPGETVICREPALVSTILGSCVAVTMHSPSTGCSAICHALLPGTGPEATDHRYISSAISHIYNQLSLLKATIDLEVKLFGGAAVLERPTGSNRDCIGRQNIEAACASLQSLGLGLAKSDIGGKKGRKLFFFTGNGDVYLRPAGARRSPKIQKADI